MSVTDIGAGGAPAARLEEAGPARARRRHGWTLGGAISSHRAPLAGKIAAINLAAIAVLILGVLYINPFRDTLVLQRETGLVAEARLVAKVFEADLALRPGPELDGGGAAAALARLDQRAPGAAFVFDPEGALLASSAGPDDAPDDELGTSGRLTLPDALDAIWTYVTGMDPDRVAAHSSAESRRLAGDLAARILSGETRLETGLAEGRAKVFAVATPVMQAGEVVGVIALTSGAGEIDRLVRAEIEQMLYLLAIAVMVSIGLSVVLASTIARPLSDLAAAAETGQDPGKGSDVPDRVRLPDMSARPDEIGRLSTALRGMVEALYTRIDANEQFAADVAHEIKNPLASLRSAVGSLRGVASEDGRTRLFDVIDHDVRRLDRLVSDISDASRLDSELVREEEEHFDLLSTLSNLAGYLGGQAGEKQIDFVSDLPSDPMLLTGLESRLAQVFVNLLSNAISFCGPGDTIRMWARRRDDRILIVVEDTGPGIPETALSRIFERFYSQRPEGQFGNNSGLGLAISKQIVEAHGGVIWAENIQMSGHNAVEPLGARFVVGLPV